jgi:hypothetical protein
MHEITRRRTTVTAGVALGTALAGCLGGDGGGVTRETLQIGPTPGVPDWSGRGDDAGAAELFRRQERAVDRLESALLEGVAPDRRDAILAFARNTDFQDDVLVYVASEGPDTCYDEVSVRDLTLDGDVLTGTAEAVDTSESGQGCGDALTFPAVLVRATADPRPARVRLTIHNGWGEETTVEATPAG